MEQQNNVWICFKLTKKAPERRHSRCYIVFIVTFEQISHSYSVYNVYFDQINASWEEYKRHDLNDIAKFRWSYAIVGLVPPCHRAFVGPKGFLVGKSWVQNIFSGVSNFSRGYFVGPKFSLVDISWVKDFFSWVFHRSKILWFSLNWLRNFSGEI